MTVGEQEVQAWVHRGTDAVQADNASRKGQRDAHGRSGEWQGSWLQECKGRGRRRFRRRAQRPEADTALEQKMGGSSDGC